MGSEHAGKTGRGARLQATQHARISGHNVQTIGIQDQRGAVSQGMRQLALCRLIRAEPAANNNDGGRAQSLPGIRVVEPQGTGHQFGVTGTVGHPVPGAEKDPPGTGCLRPERREQGRTGHLRLADHHQDVTKAPFVGIATATRGDRAHRVTIDQVSAIGVCGFSLLQPRQREIGDQHLACEDAAFAGMQTGLVGNHGHREIGPHRLRARWADDAASIGIQPAWHVHRHHADRRQRELLRDQTGRRRQGPSQADTEQTVDHQRALEQQGGQGVGG